MSDEIIQPAVEQKSFIQQPAYDQAYKKPSKLPWIILVGVLIGLSIVFWFTQKALIKPSLTYQAVFLTNGQVYFGKYNPSSGYLQNVYYIQQVQNGSTTQQSLVHMGNELHKPMDAMTIEKSQILYYEDLSSTSPVIKAIEK